jgi:hypothetical protein
MPMIKKLIIMGILTIPFLLLTKMATAQQASNEALNVTYQIKKPELVSDISIYEVALNQADLNSCRLLNKNFEIKF